MWAAKADGAPPDVAPVSSLCSSCDDALESEDSLATWSVMPSMELSAWIGSDHASMLGCGRWWDGGAGNTEGCTYCQWRVPRLGEKACLLLCRLFGLWSVLLAVEGQAVELLCRCFVVFGVFEDIDLLVVVFSDAVGVEGRGFAGWCRHVVIYVPGGLEA